MFTTEVKSIRKGKTNIKRITLLEEDGSETVINITENVHFLFGFCKTGENKVPMEVMVYGNNEVCGEIYFQMGDNHTGLVKYHVKRSTMKIAGTIMDEIKRSGVDPIAEALKKMPAPSEGKGWN